MVVNAKCNPCKEPTKYVAGFFDGPRGRRGCLFDCKNEQCEIYQVKRFTESEAVKERIKIQNLNSQKGMQAAICDIFIIVILASFLSAAI